MFIYFTIAAWMKHFAIFIRAAGDFHIFFWFYLKIKIASHMTDKNSSQHTGKIIKEKEWSCESKNAE